MAAGAELKRVIEVLAELRLSLHGLMVEEESWERFAIRNNREHGAATHRKRATALAYLLELADRKDSEAPAAACDEPSSGPQNLEPPAAIRVINEPEPPK